MDIEENRFDSTCQCVLLSHFELDHGQSTLCDAFDLDWNSLMMRLKWKDVINITDYLILHIFMCMGQIVRKFQKA